MARTQYLTFYIHLTDPAEVARLQAQYPSGVIRAPYNPSVDGTGVPGGAAIEFGAPWRGYNQTGAVAPFSWSPWHHSGGHVFPTNVATFERKSGGFFGIGRTTTRYYWVGQFVYTPPPEPIVEGEEVASPANISQRRWAIGFELPSDDASGGAEGTSASSGASFADMAFTPDASRHVGGFGYAYRGQDSHVLARPDKFAGGASPTKSWERLYLRVRQLDGATRTFWQQNDVAGAGLALGITSTGQLAVYDVDGATYSLLQVAGQLTVGTWARLDLLIDIDASTFKVYINGAIAGDVTHASGGFGAQVAHVSSILGGFGNADHSLEVDFDDWTCAAYPATLDGVDWLNGSKVTLVRPTGFGADNAWSGDWRKLLQRGGPVHGSWQLEMTSTTSGAVLDVTTDAARIVDADPQAIGVGMITVTARTVRGSTSGQLGYQIDGGAAALSAITESGAGYAFVTAAYRPSGTTALPTLDSLRLRYVKGADASQASVAQLLASVELVGVFGPEDVRATELEGGAAPAWGASVGQHNAPYAGTPWARNGAFGPESPVLIWGGTYAGDGTNGLALEFRAPVHLVMIRPLTGGSPAGAWWWSTMRGSHFATNAGFEPGLIVQARQDPDFVPVEGEDAQQEQFLLELPPNNQTNAAGVTHQYIAVSDPGMRFMCNGSFQHRRATSPVTNALANGNFLPEWAFFWLELATSSSAGGFGLKSNGHAAATFSRINEGASIANAVTFGTGQLQTQAAIHNDNAADGQLEQTVQYSAWRRADGNADAGQAAIATYGSYTGDGAASRTISFSPLSGKRPLYALVMSDTGNTSIHRDPSHTGTTSSVFDDGTANASTGITAGGIDSMTVGSVLNTNGVVYHYFVLFGSDTACNNGWSCNGEFDPVEPTNPVDGPWPEDPPDEEDDDDDDDDDGEDDDPDLEGSCLAHTQKALNIALARVGHSKQIANAATDTTMEAVMARLVVKDAVEQVLRDFPWPEFTKYAALTLVGGTSSAPYNGDWQYAYRKPADCVFERRIVNSSRTAAVNPTPPPMGKGFDSTGHLIFTNEPSAVLEYTARGLCPAGDGEPLFKDALAWKFAELLAPPFSRIPEKIDDAAKKYLEAIARAHQVIKPGVPGHRPAANASDPDAAAAHTAANLAVINRALIRIGARSIASLTEQSREAIDVRLLFEDELKSTLRDHPWGFATRYVDPLTLIRGEAWNTDASVQAWSSAVAYVAGDTVSSGGTTYYCILAHTDQVPPNATYWSTEAPDYSNVDWSYTYRLPAACVRARRLVREGVGRRWENDPPPFAVATDSQGTVLHTNEADARLEYTARIDGAVYFSDALFKDAFAWRLAAMLVPALEQPEPEALEQHGRGPEGEDKRRVRQRSQRQREQMVAHAWRQYYATLSIAQAADANEQRQEPEGDPDWISGR